MNGLACSENAFMNEGLGLQRGIKLLCYVSVHGTVLMLSVKEVNLYN